ncbi:MAG TPA: type II toxin-antitoxin system prevent-host-death family antitoxin [Thermomicrobiales bacterium]|nr:type II toxin-antitoxin system prevent-host-death family antitoxin [Thermomicrobiales bacterium]
MPAQQRPVETVMKLTDTKQQFSSVVNRVSRDGERIIVEKSGLPAAVIIPVEEYERLRASEDEKREARERFYRNAAKFSEAFRDVPEEEIERELEAIRAEFKRQQP